MACAAGVVKHLARGQVSRIIIRCKRMSHGGVNIAKLFGCCGTDCSACEAYIATQSNNQEALEMVAVNWRREYQDPSFIADNVRCDGCLSVSTVHPSWCSQCPIRACALGRGVVNCAVCPDYGCAIITKCTEGAPQTRANLEALRSL